ncbi:hypothetical protein XM38_012260 [Halomicronema hongdechloris C2206]|uniref:Uncharacterized protein n=1 Tax=Halomicronema hongdechloris C2206 TaxID=1641165 RepID=A0A1Z3HIZ4_9CYAN|nr:hypothetical protein XM38_012260 [Halomicronema hongdechloris C2206]
MKSSIIPASLFLTVAVIGSSAPGIAQVCYEDGSGNVVDLGGLCDSYEDRSSSSSQAPEPSSNSAPYGNSFVYDSSQTPFPSYLFDSDLDNEDAHQTDQVSYGNSALFVYENRYIEDFSQWPYTASATNHAEWSYIDCRTGWRGLKSSPMAGTSRTFFIPPSQTERPDLYRNICREAGLSPQF